MAEKRQIAERDALRLFSPGPVALVSTIYRDQPNLMTAAWLQPLSLDPVRVGVAIHPTRLTHEFVTKTESFVLNIPNVDLMTAVHLCGLRSGREVDKLLESGLTLEEALEVEAPHIAECVAHIECTVHERFTLGDHDLFVGDVVAVSADDEAFSTFWNVEVDAGRLLHHLGADRYAGLGRAYQASLPEETD